jgi:pimeloyl-ACP methyl ester carboxylesterase
MIWAFGASAIILGFLASLLIHRRLRQASTAALLKIEEAGGISEECFVRIGGIDQWIGIRGENKDNPILLVIHGGPGSSYAIFTPLLRSWERHFTIVQWDQRGAGKTFARTGSRASGELSMEQLTRDGLEVAEYLREQLKKDRVFLLASSFGSTFGLEMVRRRPDLFYAYIGADQNTGMVRGRAEVRAETMKRLHALGLGPGVKALERIDPDPTHWTHEDFTAVARWTMKSDPLGYRRTVALLKDAIWYAPGWSLRDILAFFTGMRFSLKQMLSEFSRYDAWERGTRFEVPIFIFQGERDVLTTPALAREFFNDVIAPVKRMELIPDTGHFAAFQQPEIFLALLLTHVRHMADVPTRELLNHSRSRCKDVDESNVICPECH